MPFEIDQLGDPVALRMAREEAVSMLPCSIDQVLRAPCVKRATRAACHDVNGFRVFQGHLAILICIVLGFQLPPEERSEFRGLTLL